MRRLIAAAGFAILLIAAAGSQQSTVKELAPGVFFRQGDRTQNEPANCGWVIFKDYVLVIDANFPWGAKKILPEIKKTTSKPIRFVFNTHYHGDHAYGGSLYTDIGATIVCSEDCAAESRTKGQAGWDKNKMVFDDGTHRVELIKVGPGHSKGDAVAYLPKEKLLFTGDLCVNWKFGNNVADADADIENWVRALGTMEKWDVRTVIPGHGILSDTNTLRGQAAYLADMWKQVRSGKQQGKTADQLVKEINLSKHQPFGADTERNAVSIRAMYKR
jgi:glyoxylase-like metal-dependent hydrolase (beta-lactamase superfamily II)